MRLCRCCCSGVCLEYSEGAAGFKAASAIGSEAAVEKKGEREATKMQHSTRSCRVRPLSEKEKREAARFISAA